MKTSTRLFAAFVLALACAAPLFAQGPDSRQDAAQPWMKFEKELGLQTTYSVDMAMDMMGMTLNSRTVRDGGKTRAEMTMPFMNLKMVAIDVPDGGKSASYTLFPDKKKYVLNEEVDGAAAAESAEPAIEELGTETYEGEACIKRRVTMVQNGIRSEMVMLFSPKQKNMPVKIAMTANAPMGAGQPSMPIQSVVLFKNYDFSTPAGDLFTIPSDYVQAANMQSILMESMPNMGAMMQQMQQMQTTEK